MPDVNVLIYAHRADEDTHERYREWLEQLVNAPQPFALSALVAVGFARIVTRAGSFAPVTPLATALGFIDGLRSRPNCRFVVPFDDHWERVADLCRKSNVTGKRVADAQHAAVAMSAGCTWVTRDADFGAFEPHGLRWQHLAFDV